MDVRVRVSLPVPKNNGLVVELVYTLDSKSSSFGSEGSNPSQATKNTKAKCFGASSVMGGAVWIQRINTPLGLEISKMSRQKEKQTTEERLMKRAEKYAKRLRILWRTEHAGQYNRLLDEIPEEVLPYLCKIGNWKRMWDGVTCFEQGAHRMYHVIGVKCVCMNRQWYTDKSRELKQNRQSRRWFWSK